MKVKGETIWKRREQSEKSGRLKKDNGRVNMSKVFHIHV
jgi:hypothetical protein